MADEGLKVNPDDLPEDVKELANRANVLRHQNRQLEAQITRMGGGVDTADARFEFTMHMLKEFGVITDEQMWLMAVAWESHLREELKKMKAHIEAQLTKQRLIVPGRGQNGMPPRRRG